MLVDLKPGKSDAMSDESEEPTKEENMRCSQCGGPPLIKLSKDGPILCLNCYEKVDYLKQINLSRLIDLYNFLQYQSDLAIGFLFGVRPPIPNFIPEKRGPLMNYNNIKVDNSTIGSINTGVIGSLDNSISQIKSSGLTQESKILSDLTQSVIESQELSRQSRDEILEYLNVIASEILKPPSNRSKNVLYTLMNSIKPLLQSISSLLIIYEQLQKAITGFD